MKINTDQDHLSVLCLGKIVILLAFIPRSCTMVHSGHASRITWMNLKNSRHTFNVLKNFFLAGLLPCTLLYWLWHGMLWSLQPTASLILACDTFMLGSHGCLVPHGLNRQCHSSALRLPFIDLISRQTLGCGFVARDSEIYPRFKSVV